jgi:hypothetical protein
MDYIVIALACIIFTLIIIVIYVPLYLNIKRFEKNPVLLFLMFLPTIGLFLYQIFNLGTTRDDGPFYIFIENFLYPFILVIILVIIKIYKNKENPSETTPNIPKRSKNLWKYTTVLLYLMLLGSFFLYYNLYNFHDILQDDFAKTLFQTWYFHNTAWPIFHSVFYPNFHFMQGLPDHIFITPGILILFSFFLNMKIKIQLIERLILAIIIITSLIMPSIILKNTNIQLNESKIARFGIFFAILWFKFFTNGQLSYMISVLCFLFGLTLFIKIFQTDSKKHLNYLIPGIIFGIGAIFNFTNFLFIAAAAIVFLLMKRNTIKKDWIQYTKIALWLIYGIGLICSAWFFPMLEINRLQTTGIFDAPKSNAYSYFEVELNNLVNSYIEYHIGLFFHGFSFIVIPIIILGVYYGLKSRNFWESFIDNLIIMNFFLSIFIGFIFPLSTSFRFLIFNEFLCVVPLARFLITLRKISINTPKLKTSIYAVLILIMIFGVKERFLNPNYQYINETDNFDALRIWIIQNHEPNSRILYEELNSSNNIPFDFEHQLPMLAYNSTVQFVADYVLFRYSEPYINSYALNGYAFNRSYDTMDFDFYLDKLYQFNVKYIIGYSIELAQFMNKFQLTFLQRAQIGPYTIWEYQNFTNNQFFLTQNNHTKVELIENLPNQLVYNISETIANQIIQISYFDFPNWHIYMDGEQINKVSSRNFITIQLPKGGNMILTIKWEKSFVEKTAKIMNIFLIVLMPMIIIFNKRNEKNA